MSEIKKLTEEINEFRDARDWRKYHNPKDLALSLTLEAAEILEHFQWKDGEKLEAYLKEHKEDIEDEIADVFIYMLQLCDELGVDLIAASRKKMEKNAIKYPVKGAPGWIEK